MLPLANKTIQRRGVDVDLAGRRGDLAGRGIAAIRRPCAQGPRHFRPQSIVDVGRLVPLAELGVRGAFGLVVALA